MLNFKRPSVTNRELSKYLVNQTNKIANSFKRI